MPILKSSFFERNAVIVARELIGCFLCLPGRSFMIVETEAYEGPEDLASHAARGETPRNSIMFGKAGYWYVYFTYGMHHMLNIVCGPERHPAAVLIRGIEDILGPGRVTKKLGIDKNFNGKKSSKESGLWIEEQREGQKRLKIIKTPRIGISYAGLLWSQKPYRFVLDGFETKKFK